MNWANARDILGRSSFKVELKQTNYETLKGEDVLRAQSILIQKTNTMLTPEVSRFFLNLYVSFLERVNSLARCCSSACLGGQRDKAIRCLQVVRRRDRAKACRIRKLITLVQEA